MSCLETERNQRKQKTDSEDIGGDPLFSVYFFYHSILSFSPTALSRIVRSPFQTCAEMLSLLRTPTEQLKLTSKRKKPMVKAGRKRVRGSRPSDRALPTHPLSDCFSC